MRQVRQLGGAENYTRPVDDAVVHVFGSLCIVELGGKILECAIVAEQGIFRVSDADIARLTRNKGTKGTSARTARRKRLALRRAAERTTEAA